MRPPRHGIHEDLTDYTPSPDVTFNWVINDVECYPEAHGHQNVVSIIHWSRFANDGTNNVEVYGSQVIPYNANVTFKNFDDVTQADMIGWLEASMDENDQKRHAKTLEEHLTKLKQPTRVRVELPWNKKPAQAPTSHGNINRRNPQ